MISSNVTDTVITFFAKGKPWMLTSEHPSFQAVKNKLAESCQDADLLIRMTDVRVAVSDATEGRAVLSEDGLFLEGEQLSTQWADKALSEPESMKVLLVSTGDRVRVEGDEDAPDGIYTVGEVDNSDASKRVYVESDEDYFGFVANSSIKKIVKEILRSEGSTFFGRTF